MPSYWSELCSGFCDWWMLQMPINDDKATSLLIGLRLETRKEHIVRAVLESVAFRFALLYETILNETNTRLSTLIKYNTRLLIY